jgi:hypothetical protein
VDEQVNTSDQDLAAMTPSSTSALIGGFIMVIGALTALLGFQTLDMLRGALPMLVGGAMMLLGLANLWLGWNIRKVRGWAAQSAVAVAGASALAALVWSVVLILAGFFSLLACVVVPLNLGSAAVAWGRIAPGRRADAARARLVEQGLGGGF